MKKISLVSGIGILALSLLSFVGNGECEKPKEGHKAGTVLTELQQPFINELLAQNENGILSIEDIVFIETDEEIDLGFDTAEYLPKGFDAYAGMELDLYEISFIEIEEEIDLGFDTAEYLPLGFDAYAGMELDLDKINFIETEEEIDLGFDTAEYLPRGFNPYKGMEHENLIETEAQIGFHLETDSK
jgi:hypothetical protein